MHTVPWSRRELWVPSFSLQLVSGQQHLWGQDSHFSLRCRVMVVEELGLAFRKPWLPTGSGQEAAT